MNARTESIATFRELGPPDLVHVVKSKPGVKDVGSYHYTLGVEASSPAALAAYINTLLFHLEEAQARSGRGNYKISQGTFCCFNAFSRQDIRVEVKIPGGVESYIVDVRGERRPIPSETAWEELYLSSVFRAILDDSDDPDNPVFNETSTGARSSSGYNGLQNIGGLMLGLRKVNPMGSLQLEGRFLEIAEKHFWKGWQLGTYPEVQVATNFSNHMANGIMKYFAETGRYGVCEQFLSKLCKKDAEIATLLAQVYLQDNEEVKAVQTLGEAVMQQPQCYGILLIQIDFLRRKKRYDLALELAHSAVAMAPSEFCTWAKLTRVYIDLGEYENALLTLNSCPMFTFSERDSHRMPLPSRIYLPLKPDTQNPKQANLTQDLNGTVFDENDPKENEVHPELLSLPALTLRGTFLQAYHLLVTIISKVGWDALLKYRSQVFVMEEEYRLHRAMLDEAERQNAQQTREAMQESVAAVTSQLEGTDRPAFEPGVPNTDSAVSKDGPEQDEMGSVDLDSENESPTSDASSFPQTASEVHSSASANSPKKEKLDTITRISEPYKSAATVKTAESACKAPNVEHSSDTALKSSIKGKRLSERWLDNLFMVLYSDLRVYTAIKAEISHYKSAGGLSQNSTLSLSSSRTSLNALLYRKPGAEWEMYGDLALRLQKTQEAFEAYTLCVQQKLSIRCLLRLMAQAADAGDIQATLTHVAKILTVYDRQYADYIFPNPCSKAVFKLIRKHGLAKVQNVLISMNLPAKQFRLVSRIFDYAESWRLEGVEW